MAILMVAVPASYAQKTTQIQAAPPTIEEPVLVESELYGSIAGMVFYDADGIPDNSSLDESDGDFPTEGVDVRLLDENGAIVQQATTLLDGSYDFFDLPLGTYIVEVDITTVPDGAVPVYDPDGGADSMAEVELTDLDSVPIVNFSYNYPYTPTTTVEGLASFLNGYLFDPTLPFDWSYPAIGVEVTLTSPSGAVYEAVTDDNGIYKFTDVILEAVSADYVIEIHTDTSPYTMIPFEDPDDVPDNMATVTLSINETPEFNYFLYYAEELIIPIGVFNDRNRNGEYGTNEAGLLGVEITVDGINEDVIVRTLETDITGLANAFVPSGPDYLITVDESSIPFTYQSAISRDPDGVADGQTIYSSGPFDLLFGYYETGCISVIVNNGGGSISIETWCID